MVENPPLNDALTRAAVYSAAMRFLGPQKERVAELLTEMMMKYQTELLTVGAFPSGTVQSVEELCDRTQAHFQQFSNKAWGLMIQSMMAALEAANYTPRDR
jgi:hypothetical protein